METYIRTYVRRLEEGSIVVVTSKIVALAESRTSVAKTRKEREALIKAESEWVKKTKYGSLTLKDNILMWNAGIDASNADGKLVLLPMDSYAIAQTLQKKLKKHYKLKKLGIIVSDSRIMPLRAGVVGVALGYAGFNGLRDYRGKKDIFGKPLQYTQTDVADSLATSATLCMGEGSEKQPLCVIEDAPVVFSNRVDRREIIVRPKDDMYRPLFKFD